MKNFRWDTKYLYWGVTALCVVVCTVLLYSLISFWPSLKSGLTEVFSVLSPVIWGLVLAYLLNPVMCFFEFKLFNPLANRFIKNADKRPALARALSLITSLLIAGIIISTLLSMVLPQVYSSLVNIVSTMPGYARQVSEWITAFLSNSPELENVLSSMFGNLTDALIGWLSSIMPRLQEFLTGLSSGIFTFLRALINMIIGVIFACYILSNKETFSAQVRKILFSIFSEENVETILQALVFADNAFTGFIAGKLLDSLIIGIICYICMTILKMPYIALISVIIGITNIIPFFGPFIGAIPSMILILMVSPFQCLVFAIFIFVLQQLDGNIIGPRILSTTVGLNGFWIMFAIIVGNGFFGLAGMLVGVPVFTLIYSGIRFLVNRNLRKRGLSTITADYSSSPAESIDPDEPEQ